jgi:ABC-type protease/lipase transport system fused ATPase/permease subunit
MQLSQKQPKGEISAVLMASRGAFLSTGMFSCAVNILMLTGPLFMLQVYDRVLGPAACQRWWLSSASL